MKTSDALTRAAHKAEMSDVEIAAAIGVSQKTVTSWRKGVKNPRIQHFRRLIEVVPGFGKLVGLEVTGRVA